MHLENSSVLIQNSSVLMQTSISLIQKSIILMQTPHAGTQRSALRQPHHSPPALDIDQSHHLERPLRNGRKTVEKWWENGRKTVEKRTSLYPPSLTPSFSATFRAAIISRPSVAALTRSTESQQKAKSKNQSKIAPASLSVVPVLNTANQSKCAPSVRPRTSTPAAGQQVLQPHRSAAVLAQLGRARARQGWRRGRPPPLHYKINIFSA